MTLNRWLVLGLAVLAVGCSRPKLAEIPVVKVGGSVLVDGKPEPGVVVQLHPASGEVNKEFPTFPKAYSDGEGKFAITTYENGDGAPPGEYKVTFFLGELNPLTMQMGGEDRLNKRYSDPKKSTITVTIVDKPVDMGKIELTSQ